MSKIQIANLQSEGSELFAGTESFLTELQSTEAHAIYGGKSKGKKSGNYGRGSGNYGRGSGRGYGRGYGRGSGNYGHCW